MFCFTVLGYKNRARARAGHGRRVQFYTRNDLILHSRLPMKSVTFLPHPPPRELRNARRRRKKHASEAHSALSLTTLVGHHRHGGGRPVTLGVEHLQGDEVLREGVQIVNTVILQRKDNRKFTSRFV